MTEKTQHPFDVGDLVRHINQEWFPVDIPTGVVHQVIGPHEDGSYVYIVTTALEFDHPVGPDNPLACRKQWSSPATLLVRGFPKENT